MLATTGCGGGAFDADVPRCGPREDLVGEWQRTSDGTFLRIDLDASFAIERAGQLGTGRYEVSDTMLRLILDQPRATKVESSYCVQRSRLSIPALGASFEQSE